MKFRMNLYNHLLDCLPETEYEMGGELRNSYFRFSIAGNSGLAEKLIEFYQNAAKKQPSEGKNVSAEARKDSTSEAYDERIEIFLD